jgi:hypothetical protein
MDQILSYADKATLHFDGWNEIIDKIQDGFACTGKISEPPFIQAIYEHIRLSSQLRSFCATSLAYLLYSPDYTENGTFQSLMIEDGECMDDFMEEARNSVLNQDPGIHG